MFDFKCEKCNEVYEVLTEPDNILEIEEKYQCPKCNGKLHRVWTFGYGKLKGPGFTRKGGIV